MLILIQTFVTFVNKGIICCTVIYYSLLTRVQVRPCSKIQIAPWTIIKTNRQFSKTLLNIHKNITVFLKFYNIPDLGIMKQFPEKGKRRGSSLPLILNPAAILEKSLPIPVWARRLFIREHHPDLTWPTETTVGYNPKRDSTRAKPTPLPTCPHQRRLGSFWHPCDILGSKASK